MDLLKSKINPKVLLKKPTAFIKNKVTNVLSAREREEAKRVAFPMRKDLYSKDISGKKILTANRIDPLSQKKADLFSITPIIIPSRFIGNSFENYLGALQDCIKYKKNSWADAFHKPHERLTSFELRDLFESNRPNSENITILKKNYPDQIQWCMLPAEWLKVEITCLFLGKMLESLQGVHAEDHKKVLAYYGFTRQNAHIWLAALLQERATSEIHSFSLLPGNQGFRVTHILPLRLDQKQQKKHKIDVLPFSLTSEFAFKPDGTFDKVGTFITGYFLHQEVEKNILKTLRNPCLIDNRENNYLFFGGDRLTTIKLLEKIPINPRVSTPRSKKKKKSNNYPKLEKTFMKISEQVSKDYLSYYLTNLL